MSIETQAILVGHLTATEVLAFLARQPSSQVLIRDMQRPDYKVIEFARPGGQLAALHLFLNSWAAQDYADVYSGPSTFVTVEYSPENADLLRAMVEEIGGFLRQMNSEQWVQLTPLHS